MPSIKLILKLELKYYDEQSLFTDSDVDSYYLPIEEKSFKNCPFNKEGRILIKETFLELDKSNYLVLKPVVTFNIIDSLVLSDDNEYEYDERDLPTKLIFNDIVDEFGNFDNYGEKSLVFSIIIEESWYQCWDGDWDSNSVYIGVVDNNFENKNIITNKSKENIKFRNNLSFL